MRPEAPELALLWIHIVYIEMSLIFIFFWMV